VTASRIYSTLRAAAWAAWRQEPDADGIRRVPMATAGRWPGTYFCLTDGGLWFVEDPTDAPGVPLEPPKACRWIGFRRSFGKSGCRIAVEA
jgi:hypothetical protein